MTKVVRIGIILVIALGLSLPASALNIGLGLDLDLGINSTTTEETSDPSTSTAGRTATTTKTVSDTNSFGIGANVILRLNDILEITPFLKFTISPSKTETETTTVFTPSPTALVAGVRPVTGVSKRSSTTVTPYLLLGSAFYWHLVRGNVVELSFGPSAYTRIGFEPERTTASSSSTSPPNPSVPNTETSETTGYDKYLDLTFGVTADVVLDVKFNPSLIFRATLTPAALRLRITERQEKDSKTNTKGAVLVLDTLASGTGIAVPMSFGIIYMF